MNASPLAVFFTAVVFTSSSSTSTSSSSSSSSSFSSSWSRYGNNNNKNNRAMIMMPSFAFVNAYSPHQYSSSNRQSTKKRRAMPCRTHAFLKEGGNPNDFYDIHKIAGDGRCLFRSLVVSKGIEERTLD